MKKNNSHYTIRPVKQYSNRGEELQTQNPEGRNFIRTVGNFTEERR